MKANPASLILLPGTGLIGYTVGGWPGVAWALGVWAAVVAIGTVAHLIRHLNERPPRGGHRVAVFSARVPARVGSVAPARTFGLARAAGHRPRR